MNKNKSLRKERANHISTDHLISVTGGDSQTDMAKLQQEMQNYQTSITTAQSATSSMARLAQKIGGSL